MEFGKKLRTNRSVATRGLPHICYRKKEKGKGMGCMDVLKSFRSLKTQSNGTNQLKLFYLDFLEHPESGFLGDGDNPLQLPFAFRLCNR